MSKNTFTFCGCVQRASLPSPLPPIFWVTFCLCSPSHPGNVLRVIPLHTRPSSNSETALPLPPRCWIKGVHRPLAPGGLSTLASLVASLVHLSVLCFPEFSVTTAPIPFQPDYHGNHFEPTPSSDIEYTHNCRHLFSRGAPEFLLPPLSSASPQRVNWWN